jgi:hypothetical protein
MNVDREVRQVSATQSDSCAAGQINATPAKSAQCSVRLRGTLFRVGAVCANAALSKTFLFSVNLPFLLAMQ